MALPSLRFRYGQFLMLVKRRARALEVFRAVTRTAPNHRRAWNALGILLAERRELESAVEAFEHALALDPSDAASHFNVGFLLQRLGRHGEAIPRFERALQADPGLERARRGLELSRAALES